MKKLSAVIAAVAALLLLFLTGCTGNPEKSTQKDLIRQGTFVCDYTQDNDESHDFKLTFNKDNTYSLYIKDYENSTDDGVVMKTYNGNWSHMFTYEYKYSEAITSNRVFSKTKKAVLGIYLLEGYALVDGNIPENQPFYFGYEQSSGKGIMFTTDKTVNEEYLVERRYLPTTVYKERGHVELSGFEFLSKKAKK